VKPTTTEWFARPVLFVADIHRTLDLYVNRLGFTESWRHEDEGFALVAQADRQGCALIFSSQWQMREDPISSPIVNPGHCA
jgi:hypothetical protein